MSVEKQGGSICADLTSMMYPPQSTDYTKLQLSETAEINFSMNNLNVTLKFAEHPKDEVKDNVLRVLVNCYKSRITAQ